MPRPRSLSGRLAVTNVVTLAVCLLLAAGSSLFGAYKLLLGEVDDEVRSSSNTMASGPFTAGALNRVCALVEAISGEEDVPRPIRTDTFVLLNARGEPQPTCPVLGSGDDQLAQAVATANPGPVELADSGAIAGVEADGRHFRVGVARLSDGSLAVSSVRYDGARNAVLGLLLVEAVVGVLLLCLLAVASSKAARRRLRPLEDMVETASAISEGDLSHRVETSPPGGSEVEQLRDALNAMLHQVESAFSDREQATVRLRRFLADASHELRTPLATVQGYLQLYEKGMLDDAERDRALARVGAEAQRMSRLVDEMLTLARLEHHPTRDHAPVDLAVLARDGAADLSARQPDRPVEIDAPEPTMVDGDEAQLRQVVGNLLTNVLIHTNEDAACTLTAYTDGAEAVLRIADTGPGMRKQDAARIFDRFFRADPDRDRLPGGSGLGMSIVQTVVEAHAGTVELDTAPGRGIAVTIRLPLLNETSPRILGSAAFRPAGFAEERNYRP